MKAKRSILGLILVIGMLLSCVGASYATDATYATAAPKFTTTRLDSANHGDTDYSQTIEVDNIVSDDTDSVAFSSTSTATTLETYGITATIDGGTITLKADELIAPTPSAGYKFKVTAKNKFSKNSGTTWQDGTTTKEFTLKILALDPVISDPETGTDISSLAGGDDADYPLKGTAITAVEITVASASPTVNMTATGLPKGLTFAADTQLTSGSPSDTVYKISGTPTETGSFTIKVTAVNADTKLTSKKSTATYTMEVLDTPGLTPTSFKEATFGKPFSQTFTVTGMTKNVPLTSGTVEIDGENPKHGLTGSYEDGKFTISGTVDSYNEFGSEATESIDVTFYLTSPASGTAKDIPMKLIINAVAPTITAASKTAAQTAAASLKKGEDGTITIEATGPGDIEWEVGTLPDGLASSDEADTENMKSTLTITGKPTVTAKNYGVDVVAKNGAGSTKVTLKLTIDSDPPVVTTDPADAAEEGGTYSEWAVNSRDVNISLTADTGPVTWKATNLPKGLSLVLAKLVDNKFEEITDKKVKTSQYALIKGKPTDAMKEGKYIKVTATDPNLKKSTELELKGVMVYAAPTIKTTKLPDIKIGTAYSATIKITGATSYTAVPTPELEGFTVTSSDGEITFSGTLTEVPTKDEDGSVIKSLSVVVTASGPGGDTSVTIPVTIKGDAPKFATSSLSTPYTKAGSESNAITIKGANPITVSAYISANDAKSAGIGTTKIEIGDDEGQPETNTGFYISVTSPDSDTIVTLTKAEGEGGSFKRLGVTIEATNAFGTTTKVFKADMTGDPPKWTIIGNVGDAEATRWAEATEIGEDLETILKDGLNFTAKDADAVDLTFTASGDNITLTASPNRDTNKLKIAVDGNTVTVKSTADTDAKSTKLTLTAKNGEGQKKITVTLNGQEAPVINVPSGGYKKEVESGKKVSLALSLKSGTKPVTWAIDDEAGDGYATAEDLADYGITLDEEKGKFEGTTTKATVTEGENPEYEPLTVMVYASNAAGSSDVVPVTIGVMGSKPKLATDSKSFPLTRGEELKANDNAIQLKADGIEADELVWSVVATGTKKTLGAYVTGLDDIAEDGTITGTPTAAGKNISVPFTVNHYGNEQKVSVKFTVVDPQPVIDTPDTVTITGVTADSKNKVAAAKTGSITVALKANDDNLDTNATGTSKITWKASKPSDNRFSVKIENAKASDSHYNEAKITVTLAKGKTITEDEVNDGIATSFTLTATNSGRTEDKISDAVTVNVSVNGASVSAVSPEEQTIGEAKELEEDVATNDELTKELGEGELTIGTERTVGMLTDSQAKVLDDGRFVIAAILPEVSATADGQYGLEVDLSENVKAGAKLYWFAFPKDAASSEDDTIIDFFDVSGTDTEVVPEDHTIVAYPWFREGVTYGPVIAVKAEDAESGEAVTEGELEETAESEAESETKEVEVSEPAEETEEAQETETEETETTETTEE